MLFFLVALVTLNMLLQDKMTQSMPWRIRPNRIQRPPNHDQKKLEALIKSMCEVELERPPRHEYGQ